MISSICKFQGLSNLCKKFTSKNNRSLSTFCFKHCNMAWKYQYDGPPRKVNRSNNNAGANNFMMTDSYSVQSQFNNKIFDFGLLNDLNQSVMVPPPPPPKPRFVNCGELRERHQGMFVELDGKVNRSRMGRFIELKDQYGVVQLVAPNDSPGISKRFLSMPLESCLTVIGFVKIRPPKLVNETQPTGKIEVHVEDIIRVQRSPRMNYESERIGGKRHFSTQATSQKSQISRALTSNEYKKAANSDNLLAYFNNREHTCDSLRLSDVNKTVQLVGWIDTKQNNGKFVQFHDGYGHTQLIVDKDELKQIFEKATENDVLKIEGRVVSRPKSHKFMVHNTGEIEIFTTFVTILDPNEEYTGPIIEKEVHIVKAEDSMEDNEQLAKQTLPIAELNKYTFRTHNCGELRTADIGKQVTLCGWLQFQRMKKFFTIRDGYGETQVIIPESLSNTINIDTIPFESIIKVEGIVLARPPAMQNPSMLTGEVEVTLSSMEVLNKARSNLPMEVRGFNRAKEPIRMEYRYIDLRFADMQRNLRLRSNVLMKMREYLINHAGFVEVETPTLFRRTPGGAQEFVVPTRKAGHFYSLVQSPQQFKQMLMSGAIDRYFQIARCYRDETTRPDRLPEFTQLDVELSFTNRESIMELIENLLVHCWPDGQATFKHPFQKMTFEEAMSNYGTDKPDIRFDMKLQNVTDFVEKPTECTNFAAYACVIPIEEGKKYPTQLKQNLQKIATESECTFVLSRLTKEPTVWSKTNGLKELSSKESQRLVEHLNLKKNDTIAMALGDKDIVLNLMGKIRLASAECLEQESAMPLRSTDTYEFLWVVDFPMFGKSSESNDAPLVSNHHPFTAPHPEDAGLLFKKDADQCNIRSQSFDLILHGQEVGGGSMRIHNAQMQIDVLEKILKIDHSHLKHLIDALDTGCPPHGGIALGLDRLISILCNAKSIRDVIAFPKSLDGKDLLSKAPVPITNEELEMYKISITK